MTNEKDERSEFFSPPCYAAEFDPSHRVQLDPDDAAGDVARWRTIKRGELIAQRLAVSSDERARVARQVSHQLDRRFALEAPAVLSVYWPFRGELDLRDWMHVAVSKGMTIALPVVVAKGAPLTFRKWTPDGKLERGVWNIPIPSAPDEIEPDTVIAPLVGFDQNNYRLGYGGGFFDRTLAARTVRPRIIGVGHPSGALTTIYPQPHDIPMDFILTG